MSIDRVNVVEGAIKPKLIHLSYDSPWNPWVAGGGAVRDWELGRRLQADWDVELWSGAFPGCDAYGADSPRVRWLGLHRNNRWVSRISYALAANRALRQQDPSKVVLSASPSIFAPVPALLDWPARTLLVIHHVVGLQNAWHKGGPLAFYAAWHERQLLSRGRHYVTVNNTVAAKVHALNPNAIVDVRPSAIEEDISTVVSNPDSDPTILFFGRLDVWMKGLDRLLDAFALVQKKIPQARLLLSGKASEATEAGLRARIATLPDPSRAQILPNVTNAEKLALLGRSWVFASPSRFEGWCLAAVEAQCCGLPVVATDADGFKDSVRDGRSGILVPNRDADVVANVARALTQLLSDSELRARMGADGRSWATGFTWEVVAKKHDEIYRRIVAESLT